MSVKKPIFIIIPLNLKNRHFYFEYQMVKSLKNIRQLTIGLDLFLKSVFNQFLIYYTFQFPSNSSIFFKNTEGAIPVCFLKARINVDLELKPDKEAK